MRRFLLLCWMLSLGGAVLAAVPGSATLPDDGTDERPVPVDSAMPDIADDKPEGGTRKSHRGLLNALYRFVKSFSTVDTAYVEPQAYNFTMMLQNTNTYETYKLGFSKERSITFSPKPSIKLGPYIGWRWIFFGYTVDLTRLGDDDHKQDFSISLYSNQLGIDFFYRKSGNDYKITHLRLADDIDTSPMKDAPFDGFSSSVKGFNLYYIFNHRKFSYPAAYSQSTIQRRSAGSALLGIGYTHHKLSVDWEAFRMLTTQRLGEDAAQEINPNMTEGKVDYYDVNINGGYAYNWVFARNWLFDISLSVGLAYNQAKNDNFTTSMQDIFRNFNIKNVNADLVARLGLVYNNMKWYAGMSTIFHSYNYKQHQFYTNNSFGYLNIYAGFNFGKR